MTERTRRLTLWATLPIVILFAASIIGANLTSAPPARAATNLTCTPDDTTFYGLDNTKHPGEIGFTTSIGCNKQTTIAVGSCIFHQAFGNWVQNLYGCADKGPKSNVIAFTHTLWFSCAGGITNTDSTTYRGESSYNVTGLTPNVDVTTGIHGSRCLDAEVASSS